MKNAFCFALAAIFLFGFSAHPARTNGASIYNTGKNLAGESLLDRDASRIRIARACRTCHGADGDAMRGVSIRFSDLSDPSQHAVPYTDSLVYRFLDEDLRSDGTKANIGVRWKMSADDKRDLLAYLKTLK